MQNISTLISQARAYGHEDTFSSTRRPRTREEFASPFSVFKQTLTLMGVIQQPEHRFNFAINPSVTAGELVVGEREPGAARALARWPPHVTTADVSS